MSSPLSLIRGLTFGVSIGTATVASATPARADGHPVRVCAGLLREGQAREKEGRLSDAHGLYLKCARSTCGGVQRTCALAAEETLSELAHVAFVVNDAAGVPVVQVLVKMDGETLLSHLDGRAVAIDPGLHEFTFGARVGEPVRYVWLTRKVMVVQGQHDPIAVTLPAVADADAEASPPPAPAPSSSETAGADEPAPATPAPDAHAVPAPTPAASRGGATAVPWIVGGAGLLGVGGGALLTFWGRRDNEALAQCSPACSPSSVAHIRQLYLAADVSLAVGGLGIGLAAILFATKPHPREGGPPTGASGPQVRKTTLAFDIQPTRSGGLATLGGTFE